MKDKLAWFCEDVKVGDEVVLLLTSGREARGQVTEIADTYVKLRSAGGALSRFFEKVLEGWEVVSKRLSGNDSLSVQGLPFRVFGKLRIAIVLPVYAI